MVFYIKKSRAYVKPYFSLQLNWENAREGEILPIFG